LEPLLQQSAFSNASHYYHQGLQMKDEDEENLHLDEELSLSSTFIQDERIN
jgi:hypothetical protein